MKPMTAVAALGLALGMMTGATAQADTFGSGANQFTIDFVTVGNPNNNDDAVFDNTAPDFSTPFGGVANTFRMGTYEVSEDMINKANTEGNLGITKDTLGTDKPATSVTWNEAARFVNWLNDQVGASRAYKFDLQPGAGGYSANADIVLWDVGDAGYNASNRYRNANAYYFLPSEDEWYKAAYYSGSGSTYFDYATGNDTIPTAVASGTTAGTAVYNQVFFTGPADIDNAGGLSHYGTMGQTGNVWEWTESGLTAPNDSASEIRAIRGGSWNISENNQRSSVRGESIPSNEFNNTGFRVASVPEPSAALLVLMAGGAWLLRRRARRSPIRSLQGF